ncbi:MAG: hypothetical protein II584_01940 [Treponema sp.]|nr:hypothetical protein [Treponema sp.]MBQ2601140.1 hypothetical protein [Treponema sp.]
MPIKLILVIALAVFVSVFTGLNLENKCTFWFFHNFKDLPVVAVIFGAFILGVIVTLPVSLISRGRKNRDKDMMKK